MKSQLSFGKDPDAGKDWKQEEKGMTEDEMVGWHHWLNEFEQTLGDGEGQGSQAGCSPWHFAKSQTRLSNRTTKSCYDFQTQEHSFTAPSWPDDLLVSLQLHSLQYVLATLVVWGFLAVRHLFTDHCLCRKHPSFGLVPFVLFLSE